MLTLVEVLVVLGCLAASVWEVQDVGGIAVFLEVQIVGDGPVVVRRSH